MTSEQAGLIVQSFHVAGIDVVVEGPWAVVAYAAQNPSLELESWLANNPPAPILVLDFAMDDQERIRNLLGEMGFCRDGYRGAFENDQGQTVDLMFHRPAVDGGRIFPGLGSDGEDLYYPPETVSDGLLGSVWVRAGCPSGLESVRAARKGDH